MAFFPMTFPFYFDEAPAPVCSPFRPVVEEAGRAFGTIPEDSRAFLDPAFSLRVPDVVTAVREFDGSFNGRIFGTIAEDGRDFNVPSTSRVFGVTPSTSRSFDDDTHEGRH
jgi:hypothetical protein